MSSAINENPTKSLEYAFPTSLNAKQFNMIDTGCWIVTIAGQRTGYLKGNEALKAFDESELPIDYWSYFGEGDPDTSRRERIMSA